MPAPADPMDSSRSAINCALRSPSSRPGPAQTTSALTASSCTASAAEGSTLPESCAAGSGSTSASGIATATAVATGEATASWSLPAPARSAASPASMADPGVCAAPPTTSTVPRSPLSSPGGGRGHPRRRAGVTISAPDGGILTPRLGGTLLAHGHRPVVAIEQQAGAVPAAEGGQAAVGVGRAPDELDRGGLVETLEQDARQLDDDVVRDDEHAGALELAGDVREQGPQAQADVRPRLAARRPVEEPADQLGPLRLLREPGHDPAPGVAVPFAHLAVAQPLVHAAPDAGQPRLGEHQVGGLHGAQVGGDEDGVRERVRRLLAEPSAQGGGLLSAEVAERHVGVTDAQLVALGAAPLGVVPDDVALALSVPHEPHRPGPGRQCPEHQVGGPRSDHACVLPGEAACHAPPRRPPSPYRED